MNCKTIFITLFLIFCFTKSNALTYYLKNNNPSSNWNDACNWYTNPNNIGESDCNGVPGYQDHVIINGHSFITLQENTTIGSLDMDNGYGWINGNYSLTVLGDAIVNHMAIQNNGKIYFGGDLHLISGTLAGSDSAFVAGVCYFDGAGVSGGRTLVLSGQGGNWRSNGIGLSYGGKLVIAADRTLIVTHLSGSATMSQSSGGSFYNYGALNKNTNVTLTLGATNFSTGGNFNFMFGKTVYSNDLTYTNSHLVVADNARLEFLNGNHRFYSSDVSSNGYILAAGNLFEKTFDAACNFTNDTLQLASGAWKFNIPLTIPNLLVTGGASYLNAGATVTQSFWWSGGHLYGGSVVTSYPQGHLYGTGGDRYTSCKFNFLTGLEWIDGNYIFSSGAEFNIPKNTIFYINLSSASKFDRSGSATPTGAVNVQGDLIKTGSAAATLNLYLNTIGSVQVYDGGLNLWRGTHNTSNFWINSGVAVQLTQMGTNFFHSNITGLGILRQTAGYSLIDSLSTLDCNLEVTGGTLTVNSNITPISLKVTAGTLNGNANILCAGDMLWGNATALIQGSGIIEVNGFTTMSGSGGRLLSKEIRMNNGGSWTGNFNINFGSTGILRVPAGATLTLSPTTTINNVGTQNAVCGIIVEGNLRKTTNFEFDFQGADLTNNGAIYAVGSFRTWNYAFVHPNTGVLSPGTDSSNTGNLVWSGLFENKSNGSLVFDCQPNGGNIRHDSLHFLHNLILGGTLKVNADPNWPSDTFTIISWAGTKTGNFSNVILPVGYVLMVDDAAKKIRIMHTVQAPALLRPSGLENLEIMERGTEQPAGKNKLELSVWPNPATDFIHVQLDAPIETKTNVVLYNVAGRCVFQQDSELDTTGTFDIPVGNLASGMYVVVVNGAAKQVVVENGK